MIGYKKVIEFIKGEVILFTFLILLIVLTILYPNEIINYPHFVNWITIMALTGLLIITTGLKESGYFYVFSRRILNRLKSERSLSIFLILLSALLSTFLTNDITLFIVVPLTLSMQNLLKNDLSKLIIFEAISTNVGSTLTPIGNPQNLFLWQKWNISFIDFIIKTTPLVVLLFTILLIFAWVIFPNKKIKFSESNKNNIPNKKNLFNLSLIMLIIYLIFLELKLVYLILPIIFICYILFYSEILLKVDWLLLVMFIIIFIDFQVIATIPIVLEAINALNLHSSGNVFLLSALTSQLISNVPSTVLISKFSNDYIAITYGVNVGGNGLVISSLANIIALRMLKDKKIWLKFHRYSIPYFLAAVVLTYFIFFSNFI